MTKLSVMVIGGGIGGLALAHGLRSFADVEVYERTVERGDWLQGYRIHINPAGARALRDCLPPAHWQSFVDTAAPGGGFGFLTDGCAELLGLDEAEITGPADGPADRHYGVSRLRLREILLDGLGPEVVRFDKTFIRYEVGQDSVTAWFSDGTSATADLLIGADGANSRVRGQLLPHATRMDTGVMTIAGKYPLSQAPLPPVLTERANIVVPRGRGSLFTGVWRNSASATDADAYAFWGFADATDTFPADVEALDGTALRQLVADRVRGWSPAFRRLIGDSDPATVNAFRVRSARPVGPWPTGRVTLIGDAIHNMTPMAGIGANTALRDADLLRRKLIEGGPLLDSVAAYEREMLGYGFAAVRQSLKNARRAASSNAFGRAMFRTVLRVTAAVPPIRHGMARSMGN
jgi:salicylate hydroxylase